MHSKATAENHYLRAAVVFGACLFLVFLLPAIGLFLNSELLFFAPQHLFPYHALVVMPEHDSRLVFSPRIASLITILQWVLAAGGFVRFARRLSFVRVTIAAIATIMVVGIVAHVAFAVFGVSVSLDGP